MVESYDDLTKDVKERWVEVRKGLEGADNTEIIVFMLAELERNDLRLRILEKKISEVIDFNKNFGKNDKEVSRNIKKMLKAAKTTPTLPIKKEYYIKRGN